MTLNVTDNYYGRLSQRQLGFLYLLLSTCQGRGLRSGHAHLYCTVYSLVHFRDTFSAEAMASFTITVIVLTCAKLIKRSENISVFVSIWDAIFCKMCFAGWLLHATAATAVARPVLAIAILSVRLSVTRVDQSKTVQARITKSSSSAAGKTLVSGSLKFFHKFERGHPQGSPPAMTLNKRVVGKICDFKPIRLRETGRLAPSGECKRNIVARMGKLRHCSHLAWNMHRCCAFPYALAGLFL